jgi:hypothetical protein
LFFTNLNDTYFLYGSDTYNDRIFWNSKKSRE